METLARSLKVVKAQQHWDMKLLFVSLGHQIKASEKKPAAPGDEE